MRSFLFIPHSPLQFEVYGYWSDALAEKDGIQTVCLLITDALYSRLSADHSYDEVVSMERMQADKLISNLEQGLDILREFENHYDCLLSNHWTVDRAFQRAHMSYLDAVIFSSEVICCMKDLLSKYSVVGALSETLFLPQRIVYNILKKKDYRHLVALNDRFFQRFYFEDGMTEWDWSKMQKAYRENRTLSIDCISQDIKDRYYEITTQNFKKGFRKGVIRKRLKSDSVFRKIARRARCPKNTNIYSDFLFESLRTSLWQLLNNMRTRRIHLRDYNEVVSYERPEGDFILFLFHMQPEYTVDGIATQYYNQAELVASIARKLPSGVTLVVKEHPFTAGSLRRPISYYSDMLRHPNVLFLHHSVESHDLLRSAIGVITLTGTIGLEAILFNIPVVVLGKIYYRFFDEILYAKNVDELIELLNERFIRNRNKLNVSKEEVALSGYRILDAFYKSTYEGQMYRASSPEAHRTKSNIELLKKGFLDEVHDIL